MIVFFADRLARAHTDIVSAYKVSRTIGQHAGQIFFPPARVVDFRIATNPEHLRGYRDFQYVVLPSASRNYDLGKMIEWARALGATEVEYPEIER